MTKPRQLTLFLIAAAATVYLVGNHSVSLWDRDEPRYAQTSKQMLESGDWVVPKLLDEVREKKPVFIYWCQAAAMKVFEPSAFSARLPSVVGVTLTLIVLAVALHQTIGPRRAFWTIFIFATSGLTIAAAKMSITDGVLILFITISQISLYQVWRGRGTWPVFIVMGFAVGLGILTKGPVVLGVMGTTLIVLAIFRSRGTTQRPMLPGDSHITLPKIIAAIGLAVLINAPWLYAMEQRQPGYVLRTLYQEVILRAAQPQEGHRGPPGFYLVAIWGIFLPWSIFLPPAMIRAWRLRRRPRVRFALAAIIGPWIMFEIVRTKLPHYILPVFPALAMLLADWVVARFRRSFRLPLGLGTTMLVGVATLYGLILPNIQVLRISNRVADVLIKEGATKPGDVIMIDYKETSLAFYQGGTIRPNRNNKFLTMVPPEQWPGWIVLTDTIWKDTPEPIRQQFDVVAVVDGLNYADRMRMLDVIVVRRK